ncbi:response regulator transcription factor [Leptolyngbya boryana FACHB-1624]|uniref:response regulator transcription factor n=1 Tax=Leptolyngbya sp. FACHB-1624 TaxID=2692802 RepID=UPI001685F842|nr:response regulator transcription factor [Leptolyngbya sp. FACHB-1624]MBD1858868.1 response regulator transcription factor [Leptolyngbya sp. FACHB-1624]
MRSSGSGFSFSLSQARILVVDDDEAILEALTPTLTQEGYGVVTANNGLQALELMRALKTEESAIDLLVLDLMLPGISGLDICRMLRQEGNTIPILILSARGSETDIVVGLEVGADDYLTKPFGIRELIARCRALLRRRSHLQPEEQPTLQHGEITLYLQEYRVTIEGREINLSPKEFSLLELFMNNPRRVYSREQLLEQIWGMSYLGDSKTVDVHIRWLREKIELDPSSPRYIMTVRGFGYRFG